jgi:hypothetical protein
MVHWSIRIPFVPPASSPKKSRVLPDGSSKPR